jgi:hypothetical protein
LGCVSKKEKYYINYLSKSRKLDYNKVFWERKEHWELISTTP